MNYLFSNIRLKRKLFVFIFVIFILISCENSEITSLPNFQFNPFTHRPHWCFASEPFNTDLPKGSINYFNSQDFIMSDAFEDSLLSNNEMSEKIQLLRCKLTSCPIASPGYIINSWSGLMQYLEEPINLSEVDYIECQILENADVFPDVPIIMRIDIGKISEDFYRPGENDVPDKEDGLVEADGILDGGEDVGLDRIKTGYPGDDQYDDFDKEEVIINGAEEYPEINGTEGNCRLDTEDLNNNGMLDLTNSYIHYSFGLDSEEYLHEINSKGLRTFRIPVDAYEIVMDSNSTPDLQNLTYLRIWFEYPEDTYVILISLNFVDIDNISNSTEIIKFLKGSGTKE
ncbi:MAG: hypothetical protein PF570_05500 [Candidatus Cloacimonetes bacterium]|jgi:hypothetical protein|nr:hypothetical protein [Candidatus Cloacimonadota bacterium]